jgi:hypothetical protein
MKEFLRLPTATDLKNIVKLHKSVHIVDGMIGSLDCTPTFWKNCPKASLDFCPTPLNQKIKHVHCRICILLWTCMPQQKTGKIWELVWWNKKVGCDSHFGLPKGDRSAFCVFPILLSLLDFFSQWRS